MRILIFLTNLIYQESARNPYLFQIFDLLDSGSLIKSYNILINLNYKYNII